MPLDPYFQKLYLERRRDMVAEMRGIVTGFVTSTLSKVVPWRRFAAFRALRESPAGTVGTKAAGTAVAGREASHDTSAAATKTAARGPKPALTPAEVAKRKTPAWKRRNAQKWDTKLFGRVGIEPPEVDITDYLVEVSGFPKVRVRVYRPLGTSPTDGPALPAVLAFFGGSFQLGSVEDTSVDAAFRSRTADAGVIHVAVDYALAPEHRYPTQVEQGYAALRWLIEKAEELGIDPERLALNGTSSGGNIAASVALLNRDRLGHPLRLQVLEVPVTDLTGKSIDMAPIREMRIPSFLARRELVQVAEAYLGDRSRASEPYASPARALTHRGLPPAVILTAEYDALRLDGEGYAMILRASGVAASAVRYLGATHEAAMYRKVVPLARRWHTDVVTALRTLHDPVDSPAL
ncbi:alpha/beta hydrolase [Mycetocola zhujimingii]|uniref:Alpha/beta hydrolase n=1 Tax=Mycetocola zhujimingii TaxID=2079792 RepID=A0A2U1TB79_9MICO|nr:alpha/beta hydrolase [Mycetocola zhujimingii]PWC06134.1 alpha/beta hydrolase [Mycetocola zhujimingii]